MKRTALTLVSAVSAVAVVGLTACGSSGSSSSGGGSSAAAGGSSGASNTVASKLTLGGPPEFATRPDGVPGLQKNYGVTFKTFKKLDAGGPLTVNALKNGQVEAADLFTTDPSIPANNFVILQDPKNNFAAQNVLPLINQSKATDGVKLVLNTVSGKLDTTTLTQLLVKVVTDKQDPVQVADGWLLGLGLQQAAASQPAKGVTLTVGSANFQENVLLADIYAEALKASGATVTTKLNIGSRETYIPALKDGSIDLIPEYSGVLLQYFDKTATATSSDDVYAALQKAVPSGLTVLDKSAAEDKDAIVVTKDTSTKYGLTSIADLAKPAS